MTATLAEILAAARGRAAALRPRRRMLEREAATAPRAPDWLGAFQGPDDVAVVAEVKRRSPSAGEIARDLDPASHAVAYADGGARALSVLTDERFFGGSLGDLRTVRHAVDLPVLRKDFLLDPVQLFESRAAGASAVLLIVRALDAARLADLATLAKEIGLGLLVEVHDATELDAALAVDPAVVGVNSRDLNTFAVDVARTAHVLERIPRGVIAVAESGIGARADVERAAEWGADAVLVGTHVARSGDPAAAVRHLIGVKRRGRS